MTRPALITDSHCHLDFPDFEGELADIVARANAAGVHRMVTICTRLKNESQVRVIAEAHSEVFYAAGTHPMSVAEEPMATVDELARLAKHPKFVGIGESGLDYHYTSDSAGVQQQSLRIHVAAARETGLPLIIHARAADDDMARILSEEYRNGAFSCVMHCFSSGARILARAALDLGFYLSMSGIAAFPRSAGAARYLCGRARWTGSWWKPMRPIWRRRRSAGRRNEPAYVAHTARVGADIHGMELQKQFAARTRGQFRPPVQQGRPFRGRKGGVTWREMRFTILGCGSSGGVPRNGRALGRLRPGKFPQPSAGAALCWSSAIGPKRASTTRPDRHLAGHAQNSCLRYRKPDRLDAVIYHPFSHADHVHGHRRSAPA